MCTVVVSFDPAAPMPLLLLGIRDEFLDRPWLPPARHWPQYPDLIGGIDQRAGGTWLAVHPGARRVACILNGRGEPAPLATRQSRGDLPLRAAVTGQLDPGQLDPGPAALGRYDPFHLVIADAATATLLSWDGRDAHLTALRPGLHMITNAGLGADPAGHDADPKAAHFAAKFAAHRPKADPDAGPGDAWREWLTLTGNDGLPGSDPRAITVRHQLVDGRTWGSSSVSFVAFSAEGLGRYDFAPVPGKLRPVRITP